MTAAANPGKVSGTTAYANLIDKTTLRYPAALAMDSQGNLFVADALPRVLVYPAAAQIRGRRRSRIAGVTPHLQTGQTALASVNEYVFGATLASNAYSGGPGGLFVVADNLYVVDTYYHRILQFPAVSAWTAESTAAISPKATAVFGQTTFNASLSNGVANSLPSANSLSSPGGAVYAKNELYVADAGNNRVLVSDGIAAATALPAAVRVAGQPGFTYNAVNLIEGREFATSSISWSVSGTSKTAAVTPFVALDKSSAYAYVSDPGNHRILAFSDYRKLDGTQIADFVIGQTDLSSKLVNSPANLSTKLGDTGLNTPTGLAVDSAGNLWVADTGNSRVLRFPAPFANRDKTATADLVLGKSDFESTLTESSASSMSRPVSLAFTSNGDLWVADVAYNRVLRFPHAAGLTNGSAADLVLGQPDFATVAPGTGTGDQAGTTVAAPMSIAIDASDRLYVTDTAKPRIMVWPVSAAGNPQSGSQGYGLGLLDSNYVPLSVTIHPDPTNQVILYADAAGRLVKMPDYVSMALGAAIDTTAVISSYAARSITIDPAGNIYASDLANRVAVHYDSAVLTNAANGFQLVAPLSAGRDADSGRHAGFYRSGCNRRALHNLARRIFGSRQRSRRAGVCSHLRHREIRRAQHNAGERDGRFHGRKDRHRRRRLLPALPGVRRGARVPASQGDHGRLRRPSAQQRRFDELVQQCGQGRQRHYAFAYGQRLCPGRASRRNCREHGGDHRFQHG